MATENLVATFPSLYSQKGTPLRFFFEVDAGAPFVIEPLRYNAGGIVLNSEVANAHLMGTTASSASISILGHDAKVIKAVPAPSGKITAISAFVVYPDGATWEGRIFEGHESALGMLVWSWELGRRLKVENAGELFGLNLSWPDVPTTVGFFDNKMLAGCSTREHPCPTQCHRMTKAL